MLCGSHWKRVMRILWRRYKKRYSKMIKQIAHLMYSERLKVLNFPTMKYHHTRGDMIELYKIVTGKYDCICIPGLKLYVANSEAQTWGHRYKLTQTYCTYSMRQHFLIDWSLPVWNSLPDSVVAAKSGNIFKTQLDRFWSNQEFVYNYKANWEGTGNPSKIVC